MSRPGRATMLQVVAPLLAIAIVLVVCRVRGLPLRQTLALRLPTARMAVIWTVAFCILIAVEEWVSRTQLGLTIDRWDLSSPAVQLSLRVVAMVVLAPVGEELVFRGLMFDQVSRGAAGVWGAVVLSAAAFAVLHGQYGVAALSLIFIDGLFLGAARAASGSVLLPMGLHALGNAYAAAQRLRVVS
ncbi:MAG: CPBP family intramembrane metalloprotease [Gemmatimonadaceae bacterium]|nr:CPBP family intramembrane metalloprotease [Gemmatimonadaceae bacterium]